MVMHFTIQLYEVWCQEKDNVKLRESYEKMVEPLPSSFYEGISRYINRYKLIFMPFKTGQTLFNFTAHWPVFIQEEQQIKTIAIFFVMPECFEAQFL